MKQNFKRAGFTIVELMIVISILILVFTFVYLPYAHFQEKVKIKQAVREAAQAINETRNLAINWVEDLNEDWDLENRSIGVYFTTEKWKNDKIYFIGSPNNTGINDDPFLAQNVSVESIISYPDKESYDWAGSRLIKETRALPSGTQFEWVYIEWEPDLWNNIFFFYDSISWSWTYLSWNTPVPNDKITLEFSYKWSPSDVLRKKLIYDKRIHTLDYWNNID